MGCMMTHEECWRATVAIKNDEPTVRNARISRAYDTQVSAANDAMAWYVQLNGDGNIYGGGWGDTLETAVKHAIGQFRKNRDAEKEKAEIEAILAERRRLREAANNPAHELSV